LKWPTISFKRAVDSRDFVLQCVADSIKVEPCSDYETCSVLSFSEDNEKECPMPVFIPVMKCEVKVSYILVLYVLPCL
jgi:hypothetical protein